MSEETKKTDKVTELCYVINHGPYSCQIHGVRSGREIHLIKALFYSFHKQNQSHHHPSPSLYIFSPKSILFGGDFSALHAASSRLVLTLETCIP